MNSLTHEQMQNILNNVMIGTTSQMANIDLKNQEFSLSEDLCTVNVVFEGNCKVTISLYADKSFLVRLTKQVLQEEEVTAQDVEDTAKEYLNVICGHLVRELFPLVNKPTKFGFPSFQNGRHPLNKDAQYCCELYYLNNEKDGVLLVLELSVHPNE